MVFEYRPQTDRLRREYYSEQRQVRERGGYINAETNVRESNRVYRKCLKRPVQEYLAATIIFNRYIQCAYIEERPHDNTMAEDILHFQSAICIDKINRGMKGAMIRASDLSRRLLEEGYNVRISTVGVSMFPLINTGDKISVMPASDLAIGDLIVCMDDKKMVCHRLARIFTRDGIRFYQTRGDAFLRFDAPVTLDRILGKVTMIERKHVSWPRRLLLLMYPVLMHSRLNAFVFLILSKLKAVFSPRQELLN